MKKHVYLYVLILGALIFNSGYAQISQGQLASEQFRKASRLVEIGDEANAVELVNQIIRENPENLEAYAFLAEFYLTHKDNEKELSKVRLTFNNTTIQNEAFNPGIVDGIPEFKDVNLNLAKGGNYMRCVSKFGDAGKKKIIDFIGHENDAVRECAIKVAVEMKLENLDDVLIGALKNDKNAPFKDRIITELGKADSEKVFKELFQMREGIQSVDKDIICEALLNLPNPFSVEENKKMLNDNELWKCKLGLSGLINDDTKNGNNNTFEYLCGNQAIDFSVWSVATDKLIITEQNKIDFLVKKMESDNPKTAERAYFLAENYFYKKEHYFTGPKYAGYKDKVFSLDDSGLLATMINLTFDSPENNKDWHRKEQILNLIKQTKDTKPAAYLAEKLFALKGVRINWNKVSDILHNSPDEVVNIYFDKFEKNFPSEYSSINSDKSEIISMYAWNEKCGEKLLNWLDSENPGSPKTEYILSGLRNYSYGQMFYKWAINNLKKQEKQLLALQILAEIYSSHPISKSDKEVFLSIKNDVLDASNDSRENMKKKEFYTALLARLDNKIRDGFWYLKESDK